MTQGQDDRWKGLDRETQLEQKAVWFAVLKNPRLRTRTKKGEQLQTPRNFKAFRIPYNI